MLVLIVNSRPPMLSDYQRGWNMGERVGMFDACGERDIRDFSDVEESDYNSGYIDGYAHAYAAFC